METKSYGQTDGQMDGRWHDIIRPVFNGRLKIDSLSLCTIWHMVRK